MSLCIDELVKDVIEIYHAEENKKEIINNIKVWSSLRSFIVEFTI